MPVLARSGAYSVRQQYLPNVLVALLGSEVAFPATSVLATPTCTPPLGHPPAVVWVGSHRKKVTEPVGCSPAPPLATFTASVADAPGLTLLLRGELLELRAGVRHE